MGRGLCSWREIASHLLISSKPTHLAVTCVVDIYRTASVLIREHSDEADLVAAERADAMLEMGSLDGQRM